MDLDEEVILLRRENKRLRALLDLQLDFRWENITQAQDVAFVRRVAVRTMVGRDPIEMSYGVDVSEMELCHFGALPRVTKYKEQAEYEIRRELTRFVDSRIGKPPPGIWDDLRHLEKKP